MRTKWMIRGLALALGLLTGLSPVVQADETAGTSEDAVGQVPPRLSFTDGTVSFFRPGASDWVQAQINTPLAPGDQLYAGAPGSLELQVGSRAFVRAWANAQLGLESQEPDFLQFRLVGGRAAFDLRTLEPGRTVEVDTPTAAITIESPGYYRVDVAGDRTALIVRRSGRATMTPVSGEAVAVAPSADQQQTRAGDQESRRRPEANDRLDANPAVCRVLEACGGNRAGTPQRLPAEGGVKKKESASKTNSPSGGAWNH